MNKYLTRSALCTAMLVVVMSGCTLTEIKCPGKIDCAGECSDLMTDDKNCGACGTVCKDGEKCQEGACVISCPSDQIECTGKCVDPQNDALNCGACGLACAETQICVDGACGCAEGLEACGSRCLNLEALHLDSCTECKQGYCDPNGDKSLGCVLNEDLHAVTCTSAYVTCLETHLNCDGRVLNGCEVEKNNENCGECGHACDPGWRCKNGSCEVTCAVDETNCDGRCLNLAELHRVSCDSCEEGFCDNGNLNCELMKRLHATACSVEGVTCDDNFLNCNGDLIDGCETSKNDNANCGACHNQCGEGTVCSDGVCTTTCGKGLNNCNGACVNLEDFNMKDCSTCKDNYCDGDNNLKSNGCEVDVARSNNIAHCGACGQACDVKDAENYCSNGVCKFQCNKGYHAHQGACEPDSIAHCGAHDKKCEIASAVNIQCVDGTCQFDCEAGSHQYGLSCEVDSDAHCGNHDTACAVENGVAKCVNGKCEFTCNAGYHKFNEICEADSPSNCGEHGKSCAAPANGVAACVSGLCDYKCSANYHKYNGGCEVDSASNCGKHGKVCTTSVENASPACTAAKCSFKCKAGYEINGNTCESRCPDEYPYNCRNGECCRTSTCSGGCLRLFSPVIPIDWEPIQIDPGYEPWKP
ncbi:MAG: hypothetical protein IJ268_10235 [Proteobacteria bacterium]|nr:hypothetical protein [Pseudomonadota bacterium]